MVSLRQDIFDKIMYCGIYGKGCHNHVDLLPLGTKGGNSNNDTTVEFCS